ncbi:MAG: hypothetical protein KJZ72_00395 [Anaerolineales bacterium]|nr:hypothetical protein [Anaerolineales bacterium]
MSNLNLAVQTQLESLQTQMGMSIEDVADIVKRTGLTRQNDIRWMLQREYGIKHEEAQMLVSVLFESHLKVAI